MKLVAWISVIALACVACKGEGKSPFSNMASPGGAPAATPTKSDGSAAASAPAAGSAAVAGSAAAATAPTGTAAGSAVTTEAAGSGTGSGSAAPEPLKVGDRVMAQWTNGSWYPGKIVAITDAGTYDINYNDGDKSRGLPASKVRRPGVAKPGGGGRSSTASSSDAPCPGPGITRRCNGTCVNIQENNNHCGSCNNRCPSGKRCDGHMFCRDADGNL